MKLLVLAICLFAGNAMAVISAPFSNALDFDGSVKFYDQEFVLVKAPAAGLAIGTVVVLDLTADNGITVATSVTNTRRAHCIVSETIAASAVGKCQTYGYMSAALFDAGVWATAGNQAFIASNAGYVTGIAAPVATNFSVGEFLDSSAASGTIELFIRLR